MCFNTVQKFLIWSEVVIMFKTDIGVMIFVFFIYHSYVDQEHNKSGITKMIRLLLIKLD